MATYSFEGASYKMGIAEAPVPSGTESYPLGVSKFSAGERKHTRVGVKLAATLDINRGAAYAAHTLDISEGGTLIAGFKGPQLPVGQMVGVAINGLILDDTLEGSRSSRFLMRVVRHESDRVALRFDR